MVNELGMSEAEFRRQMKTARARAKKTLRSPTRIVSARYDGTRVQVEFANGFQFAFPPSEVPGLEEAEKKVLKAIEVDPSGEALRWDALDIDIAVLGLVFDAFSSTPFFRQLGRRGGQAKSQAKSAAARANGMKGGRPRKQVDK
jgi:hypothetical protein